MTIDERIEKLVASQERTDAMLSKNQTLLAGVLESIMRLERIAVAHAVDSEDLNERLTMLEGKAKQRTQ